MNTPRAASPSTQHTLVRWARSGWALRTCIITLHLAVLLRGGGAAWCHAQNPAHSAPETHQAGAHQAVGVLDSPHPLTRQVVRYPPGAVDHGDRGPSSSPEAGRTVTADSCGSVNIYLIYSDTRARRRNSWRPLASAPRLHARLS